MKYIERINLIDITDNKKEIKETYNKGTNYYEEVESKQHPKKKD